MNPMHTWEAVTQVALSLAFRDYAVEHDDLLQPNKDIAVIGSRWLVSGLLHELAGMSQSNISRMFGKGPRSGNEWITQWNRWGKADTYRTEALAILNQQEAA